MMNTLFGADPQEAYLARQQQGLREAQAIDQGSPGLAVGLLAQKAANLAGDTLGMPDPYMDKAKKTEMVKQYVQQNVKNPGDAEEYYRVMAEGFTKYGMAEEAAKVLMALEKIKNESQDRETRREDMLSKKDERAARASTALELAKLKAQGKGWYPEAMKMYSSNMPKYDAKGWEAWWSTLDSTNGDFAAAAKAAGDPIDKAETWGPLVPGKLGDKDIMWQTSNRGATVARAGDQPNITAIGGAAQLPKDISMLSQVHGMVQKNEDNINEIERALAMVNDDSPAAQQMVNSLLVKAVQTGQISNKDIDRVSNTGDLPNRFANSISMFLNGTPTKTTMEDRRLALTILLKKNQEQYNRSLQSARAVAKDAGRDYDTLFPQRQVAGTGDGSWEEVDTPHGKVRMRKK